MSTNRRKTNGIKAENNSSKNRVENPIASTTKSLLNNSTKYAILGLLTALSLLFAVYYVCINEENSTIPGTLSLAVSNEVVSNKIMTVPCLHDTTSELQTFPACAPRWCGRVVTDSVVTAADAARLLDIAKAGFLHSGSDGGASILDLHSGALSRGDRFINIYTLISAVSESPFRESDFKLYSDVRKTIHAKIAETFGIREDILYLTNPTFFSRMNNRPAKTRHDEYWHAHVDKETYGSFHYTSLLYLSDHGTDFTGGKFVFSDDDGTRNVTVEPKLGRLSFFTSGSENRHFVEKVESGTRYAITVSFTCDPTKAISDPKLPST